MLRIETWGGGGWTRGYLCVSNNLIKKREKYILDEWYIDEFVIVVYRSDSFVSYGIVFILKIHFPASLVFPSQ